MAGRRFPGIFLLALLALGAQADALSGDRSQTQRDKPALAEVKLRDGGVMRRLNLSALGLTPAEASLPPLLEWPEVVGEPRYMTALATEYRNTPPPDARSLARWLAFDPDPRIHVMVFRNMAGSAKYLHWARTTASAGESWLRLPPSRFTGASPSLH